ncbi:hypothetical protein FOL46_000716 [Perkinsus olseni]|uniref:uridine/cytidine kinase n=1 Tax=Perkinsus olseni TaxID=32597 RepID=A0A7J6MG51_PEROL|nr:hypothetical protein FOL46_000716 [Perkinsus olseni]
MSAASSVLLSPSHQSVGSPGSTVKQISANAPIFDGADTLQLPQAITSAVNGVEKDSTPASSNGTSTTRDVPETFVIGVAGASAAGKTSLCAEIMRRLGAKKTRTVTFSTDQYYRTLSREDHEVALRGDFNFDDPKRLDFALMRKHLLALKRKDPVVYVPEYDFVSHTRTDNATVIHGAKVEVVIVEGIFALYVPELQDVLDMKVFTQEDADLCLVRRIKRDCGERGISVDATLTQYEAFVKPAFEAFIQPSARNADIIVPNAAVNNVAISLLVQWIESRLSNIRSASVSVASEPVEPAPPKLAVKAPSD